MNGTLGKYLLSISMERRGLIFSVKNQLEKHFEKGDYRRMHINDYQTNKMNKFITDRRESNENYKIPFSPMKLAWISSISIE